MGTTEKAPKRIRKSIHRLIWDEADWAYLSDVPHVSVNQYFIGRRRPTDRDATPYLNGRELCVPYALNGYNWGHTNCAVLLNWRSFGDYLCLEHRWRPEPTVKRIRRWFFRRLEDGWEEVKLTKAELADLLDCHQMMKALTGEER